MPSSMPLSMLYYSIIKPILVCVLVCVFHFVLYIQLLNLSTFICRSDVSNDFEVDIQVYCLVSGLFIIHLF